MSRRAKKRVWTGVIVELLSVIGIAWLLCQRPSPPRLFLQVRVPGPASPEMQAQRRFTEQTLHRYARALQSWSAAARRRFFDGAAGGRQEDIETGK